MIHRTAIVHPKAQIDSSVEIGPYVVIDEHVQIEAGCVVGPHVYVTGRTAIGPNNRFFAGCVIGEAPQDLKYSGEPTSLIVGQANVFREHVTINRSSNPAGQTVIGSQNYFMANSHVAHDCHIGDLVILANGAAMGGYAVADDRAFISGNCLVHQFCRVGAMAIMRGGTAISLDLPPYTIVHGVNELSGLNVVGMRRAGLTSDERLEIKRLYRALFRSGNNLRQAVADAKQLTWLPASQVLLEFVATTKRGVCTDSSRRADAQADSDSDT